MSARGWLRGLLLTAALLGGGHAAAKDAARIERGRYLATAADCIACHTVDRRRPFAGGFPVATPFGTIYGPNLTPDKATGIGDWSDQQFVRALHEGVGRHGEHLYPAFPYASFTKMTRDDALDIKAYLFSLPAIEQKTPANRLSFPFNQRWLLAGWKLFNFTPGPLAVAAGKSGDWTRGAYLAEALAHCQECHTPRTLTMGLNKKLAYGGAILGGWQAYNITADPLSGIGGWSDAELAQYLRTGAVAGKAQAAGGMAEVIDNSLRHLSADDVRALQAYLRDIAPIHEQRDHQARYAWGSAAADDTSLRGADGVSSSSTASGAAQLYSGHCASCHGAAGTGSVDAYYPSLLHSSAVGAPDPHNLVMAILRGVSRGKTFMPAFAERLNDEQVASLSNYLLQQFGNGEVVVSAAFVAEQRRGGAASPLPKLALGGAAVAAVAAVAALALVRRSQH
ncbi:mono/diheme cytochrome c family protein [Oxalobacteraceae bacterium GrIS 1.11]